MTIYSEAQESGTVEMAMPSKTPISLLQELCAKRGLTPKYDLLSIEGAVHEPTFVYRVTVGDLVANGSGQSKKKAKHHAAKNALEKMLGGNLAPNSPLASLPDYQVLGGALEDLDGIRANAASLEAPCEDGIPGNPVGQLQELAMAKKWPPPVYDLVSEEGLPHERQFVISCTIWKYKETGVGNSKRLAKRSAAYKMLQRVKDLADFTDSKDNIEELEEEIDALSSESKHSWYQSLKEGKHIPTLTHKYSQKVSQFHKTLKNSQGKMLESLHTRSLNTPNLNPETLLQEIAEEQNFEVTYVSIDELSLSGKNQCLLQLSTLPVAVCHGTGNSSKEAQSHAAHNALEYLKIMTKK